MAPDNFQRVGAFRRALLRWYDASRRPLPWRGERDPYRVLVSEAMLQQTRVEVVVPRYSRFLERFPDFDSLAAAGEDEVVAAWSGLGYYRRARSLHAAARIIVRDHGGSFPLDPGEARGLPGVGRYTAHAVLSIAAGRPLAVVDGNVERVLSRLFTMPARPASRVQAQADRLLDPERPGDANQAMMDLGALICLPRRPRCEACPVRRFCRARIEERVMQFPSIAARPAVETVATTIWIVKDARGRSWMEKRARAPLRGLWMFPWREGTAPGSRGEAIGVVSHSIMSRRYECAIVRLAGRPAALRSSPSGPGRWVETLRIHDLPHPSLVGKVLDLLGS